jgi:hypothetical protein
MIMERKKITQKKRFETDLKVLNRYYSEKAIDTKKIYSLVHNLQELIFSLKVEKDIRKELERLQKNGLEYRNELKNAFQCQELIRHYKLELIEQLTKLK